MLLPGVYKAIRAVRPSTQEPTEAEGEGSGRRNPLEKVQDKIGNRTNVS